jgi:hypothetical protein
MPPVMDTESCLTVLVLRGFDDGDMVRRRPTIDGNIGTLLTCYLTFTNDH